jgi:DNA-binding FadR family transcriptional regulator
MTDRAERRRYLEVAEYILRAVAAGSITRGDRLPNERDLSARCGVSRASVREALLALELGGVIESRPGSGWYLTGVGVPASTPVTPGLDSSPRDLLEVRRVIEPHAAQVCAWRIEPPDVRRLAALIDDAERVSAAPPGDDLHPFVQLNLAFHRELAQLCGNAILARITSHLVDANEHPLWMLVDGIAARSPQTRSAQLKEHRAILAAIAEHRGEDAARAMSSHLGALTRRFFGATAGRRGQAAPGLA